MWFNPVVFALLLTTTFIGDEYFQAGENDEESDGSDFSSIYSDSEFRFEFRFG